MAFHAFLAFHRLQIIYPNFLSECNSFIKLYDRIVWRFYFEIKGHLNPRKTESVIAQASDGIEVH